jgi:hypothetical protein
MRAAQTVVGLTIGHLLAPKDANVGRRFNTQPHLVATIDGQNRDHHIVANLNLLV